MAETLSEATKSRRLIRKGADLVILYSMACLAIFVLVSILSSCSATEYAPVIGVMTQRYWRNFSQTYIAASYVKWIESAGGRVIPILLGQDRDYYEDLFKLLNGVLFPGIDPIKNSKGFQAAQKQMHGHSAEKVYDIAKQLNDRGDYFPVWGTCLGMEFMAIMESEGESPLQDCSSYDQALPLNFTASNLFAVRGKSRLFKEIPSHLHEKMKTKRVTINYHQKCLTPQTVKETGLDKRIKVLATNRDKNGLEFVSVYELTKYPFYGVQFHPEKVPFEFIENEDHQHIPHGKDAVDSSQYMADFFVNEARKSKHFSEEEQLRDKLIYNFNPKYTEEYENYEQMYFF